MMSRPYSVVLAAALIATALLAGCAGDPLSSNRRAGVNLDNPDQAPVQSTEDTPPPPPAYDLRRLIDVDMPRGSSVKIGIDPKTITIDRASGVVRYVVVARGPAAVNAMYEGIRCATGEFRVYARQVKGQPWEQAGDSAWRSMNNQTGVLVQHPLELAQDGICDGPSITATADRMAQLLRLGQRRPDLYSH